MGTELRYSLDTYPLTYAYGPPSPLPGCWPPSAWQRAWRGRGPSSALTGR